MRLRRLLPTGLLALLLAAAGVPLSGTGVDAGTTSYTSSCDVNLRAGATMSATILTLLPAGATVAVTGAVSGDSWSVTCGTTQSGSSWYAISSVNGTSVTSLYGVSTAYAATGMFRLANVYLEGVDIAKWQGSIDFGKVKAAGKKFVAAKATEGIGYLDPTYRTNRANAINAGLGFTAYHFARPDLNLTNPTGEADWFVDNMALTAGMLVPALDLETVGSDTTVAQLQGWVGTWLDRVYARTGTKPMIYVSPSFWRKYMGDTTAFADKGYSVLWVAHWGTSNPSVPANNWSNRSWTFWQYDDCGSVPGIPATCVDLDRYNGTDLTPVTVGATFALSAGPVSAATETGGSASYAINLSRSYFTLPINLTASGLPAGAVATFSPANATGDSATLAVATSRNGTSTPPGTYAVTVSGSAAGKTVSTKVSLVVGDGVPPKVVGPVPLLTYPRQMGTSTAGVYLRWSATDPSGILKYGVARQVNDGSWSTMGLPSALTTSITVNASFGTAYRFAANASDRTGNLSAWAYGPRWRTYLNQQTTGVAYGGTWANSWSSSASGGSLRYSTRRGAYASYTFTGSGVAWVAYKGPNRGSAAVYVDGVYRRTVSLYSGSYSSKAIAFAFNWGTNGTHTIKVVNLGTAGRPRIDVDAFIRLVQG